MRAAWENFAASSSGGSVSPTKGPTYFEVPESSGPLGQWATGLPFLLSGLPRMKNLSGTFPSDSIFDSDENDIIILIIY